MKLVFISSILLAIWLEANGGDRAISFVVIIAGTVSMLSMDRQISKTGDEAIELTRKSQQLTRDAQHLVKRRG